MIPIQRFYERMDIKKNEMVSQLSSNQVLFQNLTIMLVISSLLTVILGYMHLMHWIVKPILSLSTQVNRIKQGDSKLKPLQVSQDEIGELAASLNSMNVTIYTQIKQLEAISLLDSLTQLANRRAFDLAITSEWGRHQRMNENLSLLVLDIDDFKTFNDKYGHL